MAERDTRFGGNLETANIRPREYQPSDGGIANVSNVDDRSLFQRGYERVEPYIPEVRDDMLNWDLGNWNVGVGEGKFNLGYTLPLGGASLRKTLRPLKKGIDSLNVTDPSDFYMDKIIRDNPEEVMYNLMRQYPSEEMQEYYDQPIDRYKLDFGGPEIDKWMEENPGSTIGDLYDYLPELRGTGTQPGDFWPGGASI
jgi:hypothetical protein